MRQAVATFAFDHKAKPEWYALLIGCLVISMISVHDAMLVILNHEVIREMEQNPIGVWLIDLNGGKVWLFVFVKLLSTALVCAILFTLFKQRKTTALCAAGGLVAFQMMLLCYLTTA